MYGNSGNGSQGGEFKRIHGYRMLRDVPGGASVFL